MSEAHAEVRRRYGVDIADDLETSRLLRPDTVEKLMEAPTHWRVRVWRPDTMKKTSYWDVPQNVRNEIKGGLWKGGVGECLFDSQATARRNAKIMSNAGYNTKITALVLVETEVGE